MKENYLITEGDVNFSEARIQWYSIQDSRTLNLLEEDSEYFMHQALSSPCLDVLAACNGIYISDINGKTYMDFHGNSVHHIGYRNEFVINKLIKQMGVLPFSPRRFTNLPAIQLAKKLSHLLPGNLKRVLFTPGGTSAVGIAIKLARVVTGKYKVVSLIDSFHGASLDTIAVGGEEQFKKYMGPFFPQPINIAQPEHFRNNKENENDIHFADILEDILQKDKEIGAFIAEPIRNTDVQIPSIAYWKRVREICSKHNVLLILDEIPIAFGRTGKMFAFEHFGIEPDIICLGKSLGAGIIPFAAMVCREEYNIAKDVSLGHYTHEKSPLGSIAALAMIEFIEQENLLDKVKADEVFICQKLYELKERFSIIGDIRGIGLLWAIELVKDQTTKAKAIIEAEKIMYSCLDKGLSFKISQGNVIQLCPPLIISRDELTRAISKIESSLQEVNIEV